MRSKNSMRTMLTRLWTSEDGAVLSAEVMLVATILVIGVLVGLKSVRDSVVMELADISQAFNMLNQRFFMNGQMLQSQSAWGGMNGSMNAGGWGGSMGQSTGCTNVCLGATQES